MEVVFQWTRLWLTRWRCRLKELLLHVIIIYKFHRPSFNSTSACINRYTHNRGSVFSNAIIWYYYTIHSIVYCTWFLRVWKTFSRPDDDSLLMDFAPSCTRRRTDVWPTAQYTVRYDNDIHRKPILIVKST